jgi:preprotein translocase subunit SecE
MARNQGGPPPIVTGRGVKASAAKPPVKAPVIAPKTATPDAPKPQLGVIGWFLNLPKFAKEVRAEGRKITWTTWKETWITSVMVFIMVVMTGVFFLIVDQLLSLGMQFLLKLAA